MDNPRNLTEFGLNLAEILVDRGMTQKDLAEAAGYHRNRIYQLLRTKNPNKRTVVKLAKALRIRPSVLVS
jgi:transcriptional regulator with XRE-family HTH domain